MAGNLIALLRSCAKERDLCQGIKLHVDILKIGLLEKRSDVGNDLINLYAKCGAFAKAQELLDGLAVRSVVSWNALIAGYIQDGFCQEALSCLGHLQHEGLSPNAITFTSILKACGSTGALSKGKQIHDQIVDEGLLKEDALLGTSLMDMYIKCGELAIAQNVLTEMPLRDEIAWNTLITGYAQYGHSTEALNCFEKMQNEGFAPGVVTFICILRVCGNIGALDKGEQIHSQISRQGLGKNLLLMTALVDMYAKCGAFAKARNVLKELPVQDVVLWSTLISAYIDQGQIEEAFECFEEMQRDGLLPDAIAFTSMLKACGSIGATDKGVEIHNEIVRQGLLSKDLVLGTALVDMYAKCGALPKAQEVLEKLPMRDVVSWSVIIAGYAHQGQNELALYCLDLMQQEGHSPNAVTIVSLLNGCSHSGILDGGQAYFASLFAKCDITLNVRHQACVVDFFGRAGEFDKALAVIKKTPASDNLVIWSSLLGACQKWGNVKLGRLAFDQIVGMDKCDITAYVCMTNLYLAAGMQRDADEIEAMMRARYEACG